MNHLTTTPSGSTTPPAQKPVLAVDVLALHFAAALERIACLEAELHELKRLSTATGPTAEVMFGPALEAAFSVQVLRAEQLCFRPRPSKFRET